MFEALTKSFLGIRRRLTDRNVREGLKEVRRALLSADVNFRVVCDFIERVKSRAIGEEALKGVRPADQFIAVVQRELEDLLGPVDHVIPSGMTVILIAGLQGSGKTTTTGKLGHYFRKRGRKPMLVAGDMVRPAAVEQLKSIGREHGLPVYWEESGRVAKICRRGVARAVEEGCDVVVLDTQGRLHVDGEMMAELGEIRDATRPQQVLLVVDAMMGQDAVRSADAFNRRLGLDGIVMTKLDGDARGGAALTVKAVTGKPIRFAGVGEKIGDLEEFHPDRMAGRILGMGDVVSLVERAQATIDRDHARRMEEKIRKDELSLGDFLGQLQQMKKMGPLKQVMKMLPGEHGEVDEDEVTCAEAIMQSMTPQEREHPELLSASRRQRVARGAGRPTYEVNRVVRRFWQARGIMRNLRKKGRWS